MNTQIAHLVAAVMALVPLTAVHAATIGPSSTSTFSDTSGLDTSGTFVYAVDIGGDATGTIGDATFTVDSSTSGVTSIGGTAVDPWQAGVGSMGDAVLEHLMNSIRHSNVSLTLAVTSGAKYKLQVWTSDSGNGAFNRNMDLVIDGVTVFDNIAVTSSNTAGTLFTVELTASTSSLIVSSPGNGGGDNTGDANGTFMALTLETIQIPTPAALPAGLAMIGLLAMRRRRN